MRPKRVPPLLSQSNCRSRAGRHARNEMSSTSTSNESTEIPSQCSVVKVRVRAPSHRLLLGAACSLLLLLLQFSIIGADGARNANPTRSFEVVNVPALYFNVTTSDFTGSSSIAFHPTFGGTALPLSNQSDFTIDVPVMLPHKDDDISGCGTPWQTQNEFGQSFAGAFLLIRQSACTYTTYLYASYSGAAGLIAYGCPAEAPYNCVTKLLEVIVYAPVSVPLVSVATADGDAMVAFLTAAKAAANGTAPSKDTLTIRLRSTGDIVSEERAALISIMSGSTMGPFSSGKVPDVLPLWSLARFSDLTIDPCRDRVKGLWCEAGHVVLVSAFYHEWYNTDTTSVLPAFGALTRLRYMNVQANQWGGPIPVEWCALTNLQVLWLDLQVHDSTGLSLTSLPDCMGAWSQMQELRLYDLQLTSLPGSISSLTALQYLVAPLNQISSLPDITTLVNLEQIDVSQNALSGSFPSLPSSPLSVISLGTNGFSGDLNVSTFDDYPLLTILDINTNSFTGSLPNFIGTTALVTVDCGSQRNLVTGFGGFTGPMPISWKNLVLLSKLYLQENLLTAPIYAPYMLSLEYLDVSHNLISSLPTTDASNAVGVLVNSLTSPSQVSVRASHNLLVGALASSNFILLNTMIELALDNNNITALTTELFISTLTNINMSYNALSLDIISTFPSFVPIPTFVVLDLRGNPQYSFDSLPTWTTVEATRVQASGDNFLCAPLSASTAPLMSFLVDPSFYKYEYCDCQAGTFGKAPLCSNVPNSASLNPFHVITSDEIGGDFATLISSAEGIVGSQLMVNESDSTGYVQSFSDSMYGDDRLTLGMSTSWVIDLRDIYVDTVNANAASNLLVPSMTNTHVQNDSSLVLSSWTGVRVITVRVHLSQTEFVSDDSLSVYEGGSDLKGRRVFTVRGTDVKTPITYSDDAFTAEYTSLYNASVSKVSDAVLLEARVFGNQATVQFTSRAPDGLHFFTTYSYSFVCPEGYFYNTAVMPNACTGNLQEFVVSSDIRAAVFAVSALALAFVVANLIILIIYWDSPIFKAASRGFMMLMLVLLLAMPLGAMLYAAIPTPSTPTGDAICIGRPWLSCLPLAGFLAILLAKTARLDAIFGASTLQVKKHSDMDILRVVLVVCTLQIAMLAVFTGMPLSRAQLAVGSGSQSNELVIGCSQEDGFMSWIGAEIAFIGCLIIPTAYLGFKTRDLPSQYNESGHIQNAIVLLLFFGCIIIPLDIFIQDNPEAAVLIQGLGQAFLCIMITASIFGPKLYYLTQAKSQTGNRTLNTHMSENSVLSSGTSTKHRVTGATPNTTNYAQRLPPTGAAASQMARRGSAIQASKTTSLKTSPPVSTTAVKLEMKQPVSLNSHDTAPGPRTPADASSASAVPLLEAPISPTASLPPALPLAGRGTALPAPPNTMPRRTPLKVHTSATASPALLHAVARMAATPSPSSPLPASPSVTPSQSFVCLQPMEDPTHTQVEGRPSISVDTVSHVRALLTRIGKNGGTGVTISADDICLLQSLLPQTNNA